MGSISTCHLRLSGHGCLKGRYAIHWMNHYPVDNTVCFVNSYPLDSNLCGGYLTDIPRTERALDM